MLIICLSVISKFPDLRCSVRWWQRMGSNHRPSAYEAPALTTELRCRINLAGS